MADVLQLRVVTPKQLLLDEEVREVTAPGADGEIGVLPNHTTYLGALDIGMLHYRTDRGVSYVAVRGGFAEIIDNVMTILADDAAFGADVDVAAAQAERDSAAAQLRDLSQLDDAYATADADRRWAEACIEAARAAR